MCPFVQLVDIYQASENFHVYLVLIALSFLTYYSSEMVPTLIPLEKWEINRCCHFLLIHAMLFQIDSGESKLSFTQVFLFVRFSHLVLLMTGST